MVVGSRRIARDFTQFYGRGNQVGARHCLRQDSRPAIRAVRAHLLRAWSQFGEVLVKLE
jgi:hypothetical protein